MLPTGYQFKPWPKSKPPTTITRSRSFKRKVDHVELEDDVYDGIKRLYNEDTVSVGITISCGSQYGQDSEVSSTQYVQAKQVCAN